MHAICERKYIGSNGVKHQQIITWYSVLNIIVNNNCCL